MGMSFLWESHRKRPMGWDRHKLLWDGNGTDKYVPWTTLGFSMGISFLWESHGKRPMGWDRHKLLWDGNGTDKYAHGQPWKNVSQSTKSLYVLKICGGMVPLAPLAMPMYNLFNF